MSSGASWRQATALALGRRRSAIYRCVQYSRIYIAWVEYRGKMLYGLFARSCRTSDGWVCIDIASLICVTETMNGMEEQLRQFDLLGRDWETINDPAIREAQQEIILWWCISHGEEPPK